MKPQDSIIKNISLLKFKDPRVIQAIVYHPLLFAKQKMVDPDDIRPVRIRYFATFVQKYYHNKLTLKKKAAIENKLDTDPNALLFLQKLDPSLQTVKQAKLKISLIFMSKDNSEINEIHKLLGLAIQDE
jgi:hypothetical protein